MGCSDPETKLMRAIIRYGKLHKEIYLQLRAILSSIYSANKIRWVLLFFPISYCISI